MTLLEANGKKQRESLCGAKLVSAGLVCSCYLQALNKENCEGVCKPFLAQNSHSFLLLNRLPVLFLITHGKGSWPLTKVLDAFAIALA